jgi:hypothetical protein
LRLGSNSASKLLNFRNNKNVVIIYNIFIIYKMGRSSINIPNVTALGVYGNSRCRNVANILTSASGHYISHNLVEHMFKFKISNDGGIANYIKSLQEGNGLQAISNVFTHLSNLDNFTKTVNQAYTSMPTDLYSAIWQPNSMGSSSNPCNNGACIYTGCLTNC